MVQQCSTSLSPKKYLFSQCETNPDQLMMASIDICFQGIPTTPTMTFQVISEEEPSISFWLYLTLVLRTVRHCCVSRVPTHGFSHGRFFGYLAVGKPQWWVCLLQIATGSLGCNGWQTTSRIKFCVESTIVHPKPAASTFEGSSPKRPYMVSSWIYVHSLGFATSSLKDQAVYHCEQWTRWTPSDRWTSNPTFSSTTNLFIGYYQQLNNQSLGGLFSQTLMLHFLHGLRHLRQMGKSSSIHWPMRLKSFRISR